MKSASYSVESLGDGLIAEIEPMLHKYYDLTEANTDIPPYDFDWAQYKLLCKVNNLVVTTARRPGDVLIGVAMYLVVTHPHHRSLLMAECDTIAVDMNYRRLGVGQGLYRYTESRLIERGVKMITNRFRTCYRENPMFEELGFHEWERVYMKKVG